MDSASSDVSQFSIGTNPNSSISYVSPQRMHMPPSDIESEYGDESDPESNSVSWEEKSYFLANLFALIDLENAKDAKITRCL